MNKKQAQGNSSLKRSLKLILACIASLRDATSRGFWSCWGGGKEDVYLRKNLSFSIFSVKK
ncbi:MAG TPA: hypothetical protein VJ937_07470 [Salinivirga sp.]|uniref:hypothetical protein n=1 Tax=Salinivirga sp. TaxID=1970192 RepID=UPI002B45DA3E|nr:hypothetical protein [Salinivirga sp.]HKK59301.1 hypothetical protein [Salinivirga sp.]